MLYEILKQVTARLCKKRGPLVDAKRPRAVTCNRSARLGLVVLTIVALLGSAGGAQATDWTTGAIIDDSDPGFSVVDGFWTNSNTGGLGYGDGNYSYTDSGGFGANSTVAWTFTGVPAGFYTVQAMWAGEPR
jgi:hypothetical protein